MQGARDIQLPSSGTVNTETTSYTKCFRCGRTNHSAPQCRYKDAVCKKCNKTGHLAKVCQSKKTIHSPSLLTKKRLPTNIVSEQLSHSEKHEYALFTIQDTKEVKTSMVNKCLSQLCQNQSSKKFHQNPYRSP